MAGFPYESAPAHRVTELNLKKNISDMHSSCLRDNLNQFTVKKKKTLQFCPASISTSRVLWPVLALGFFVEETFQGHVFVTDSDLSAIWAIVYL
jgi:hypothetical protein